MRVQLQGQLVVSEEVHGKLQRFVIRLKALGPLTEIIVRAAMHTIARR